MDEADGRSLSAAPLNSPRFTTVIGPEDRTAVAHDPSVRFIEKLNAVERKSLAGRMSLPGLAKVGAVPHDRSGFPCDPNVFVEACGRMEIDSGQHIGWKLHVSKPPALARTILAQQHQAALPDRDAALAADSHSEHISPTKLVNVGGIENPFAHRG
jgi:hypothetical protein